MNISWKRVLTYALCLFLGFALGVVSTRFGMCHGKYGKGRPWELTDEERAEKIERKANFFSRKLDLNDEQRTKVSEILTSSSKRMQELHQKVRPEFKTIREESSASIKQILTPEQQVKFEEFQKKREKSQR